MNQLKPHLPKIVFPRLNAFRALAFCAIASIGLKFALPAGAQMGNSASQSTAQARRQAQNQSAPQLPSERDVADTQDQLQKLLRLSPVLTTVVARDPSLLADQDYVNRNNPELAQFMASHPDIAKNPEFYLFNHLDQNRGHRDQALERAVWPDLVPPDRQPSAAVEVVQRIIPLTVGIAFFVALVWIVRIFLESHRWNRAFKQQNDVHSRLIDKFSTTQELAAYMDTEAGKRFLEASPVQIGPVLSQHMPNAVARVLTPLQVGIVMTLLGIGLLLLRNAGPDMATPMAVLGTLALMPGIGFILSAGVTWILAQRLGLMPDKPVAQNEAGGPFGSQGRQ